MTTLMRIRPVLSAAAAALSLAATAPAGAGVVAQEVSFSAGADVTALLGAVGTSPYGVALTGARASAQALAFDGFDTRLGRLDHVVWQLLDARYEFELHHHAEAEPAPQSQMLLFQLTARAAGSANLGGQGLRGLADQSFNFAASDSRVCRLGGDGPLHVEARCDVDTAAASSLAFTEALADPAEFLVGDFFEEEVSASVGWNDRLDVGSTLALSSLGPDPAEVTGSFRFSGLLRLVYVYTDATHTVPEPASLWLVAALLPWVCRGRRGR